MFPVIEYIKTCLNGLRSRIEKVEKSISQALASVKEDIIQDIKNVQKESAKAIKSSTADWGQNDSNALDYVKNRTHYMLPATPIGSLEFTATSSGTIEYTMTSSEEEFAMFMYFQSLRDKGEVLEVTVGGKTGLLAVTFDRGHFNFNGVFAGTVKWSAGNVLSLVAQNDFITFNQGDKYTASFEDTTTPYYSKLDFNYMPDNVYHSENAPVKFGAGKNSTVQGESTTATGVNAHAEGLRTKASGSEAHAEGSNTVASGTYSHAEGSNTVASGTHSHAEGHETEASGMHSHAEGDNTVASGSEAHAEGNVTVANRQCMHVEGEYNLYDDTKYFDVVSSSKHRFVGRYYAAAEYVFDSNTGYYTLVNAELKNVTIVGLYYANPAQYENGIIDHLIKPVSQISDALHNTEEHDSTLGTMLRGKYVHVVGNGVSSARSNAHTLDWDGNGWFAGDVFVGGASQDEGVKLLKAGEAIPIPQTASVGQTVVVKAVDENGKPTEWEPATLPEQVKADWNQNDSAAADYVKNRTHYTEMNTALEYGVLSGFEDNGSGMYQYLLPYALDIYEGLKVEVTWDNQVYHLTATQPFDAITFFGNNVLLGGEDSGEPFGIVIKKLEGITAVVSTGTETSHEVGIVAESPVRIKPYFLPSNIAYLQNGLVPLYLVIPKANDVFGGVIAAGGVDSTLSNPYPNKKILNDLTLETFNAMLDGTVYLPKSVLVDGKNIASVSLHNDSRYIGVSWISYSTYAISGHPLAGAKIEIYYARIHEDVGTPGTIVSEYAIIVVANKKLT